MRVAYMGTPDFAVNTLEKIIENGHEVCAVFTQPDKPVGRKKELRPPAVKTAAAAHGLPVFQPEKLRGSAEAEQLRALQPDVIVVAAYGQLLPREILEQPPLGCLNVHASLLPAWRGAAPIQWAVLSGDAVSGVTIMQMNEGLDTGDMLARTEIALAPEETGGSLFDRLAEAGAELLADTLRRLSLDPDDPERQALRSVPQPEDSPTPYARMIKKEDGRIDWSADAAQTERQIRAMDPWPCAFTVLGGKTLKIWKAAVRTEDCAAAGTQPGTVLSAGPEGILVMCGSKTLLLTEIQLEGKKRMRAADYLRGHAVAPGELLG